MTNDFAAMRLSMTSPLRGMDDNSLRSHDEAVMPLSGVINAAQRRGHAQHGERS